MKGGDNIAVIKIKTIKNNLQAVIKYAKNGEKTDNGILVTAVNCVPDTAYEQMELTKKSYHKEDKTQGYHIIQSFKGNEVKPEKANQIGKELAENLWGDKYQVLVCTHINKDNVHNHIILNSVSFIDGKKYHNGNTEIALLREESDRLCNKYGLSIIETEKAQKEKFYREKRIEKFSRTDKKMNKIRNDIDKAIKSVKKYSDFKLALKAKGYEINDKGQYFTVKSPYYSRSIRIDKVWGEEYSVLGIERRIYNKAKELPPVANFDEKYYKKSYTGPKINKFLLQTSSLYRLYVHYLYLFKILPAKNQYKKQTPEYFKQKRENDRIFEEINFMARNYFKSIGEIREYQKECEDKLPELKSKRENLWRKYNKVVDSDEKSKIMQEIEKLTQRLDKIQAHKNECGRMIKRFEEIKEEYLTEIKSKEFIEHNIIGKKEKKNKIK